MPVPDAATGTLPLRGGRNDGGRALADLQTWRHVHPSGAKPPDVEARVNHVGVLDPASGSLLIHGGYNGDWQDPVGSVFDDLWAFDLSGHTWRELLQTEARPPARGDHVAVLDPASGSLLIHGGQDASGSIFDDLWAFDLSGHTWRELRPAGAKPETRISLVGVLDPASGSLLIHGGMAGPGFAFSDLWAFDLSGHTWRELLQTGAKPPARGDHVAVLDPASGSLLIHGGQDASGSVLGDLWAFDVSGPPAGLFSSMGLGQVLGIRLWKGAQHAGIMTSAM